MINVRLGRAAIAALCFLFVLSDIDWLSCEPYSFRTEGA